MARSILSVDHWHDKGMASCAMPPTAMEKQVNDETKRRDRERESGRFEGHHFTLIRHRGAGCSLLLSAAISRVLKCGRGLLVNRILSLQQNKKTLV